MRLQLCAAAANHGRFSGMDEMVKNCQKKLPCETLPLVEKYSASDVRFILFTDNKVFSVAMWKDSQSNQMHMYDIHSIVVGANCHIRIVLDWFDIC